MHLAFYFLHLCATFFVCCALLAKESGTSAQSDIRSTTQRRCVRSSIKLLKMTLHNFSPRKTGSILKDDQWIGVDLMMLLYSMLRSTAAIWRAQTQLPPVPQRQAQAWMTSWYQMHNFQQRNQVLVFVLDGRISRHKVNLLFWPSIVSRFLYTNH